MRRLLSRLLGLDPDQPIAGSEDLAERQRTFRFKLAKLYLVFGVVLSALESAINFAEGRPGLGYILAGMALVLFGCLLMVKRRTELASALGVGTTFLMLVGGFYYVTHEGVTEYNVWIYVFIPVAFSLQGTTRATFWVAGLSVALSVIYLSRDADSPLALSGVFVRELSISFAAVFVLSLIFQFIREFYEDLLKTLNLRLEELATTDQLTQAYNRRMMENLLGHELERSRQRTRVFSVILLDLDHFKHINDTYGHLVGDTVLQQVADVVRQHIRPADYFGRWGGEEFLVLCGGASLEDTRVIAERVREALEGHDFDKVGRVTASFGVSVLGEGDDDLDGIIRRADDALYEAKERRNTVVVAAPSKA